LSTKIHTLVDALGNPLGFFLSAGQAHDLQGADALLPHMQANTVLADKAFDADQRVIEPLLAAGKTVVIPPKSNRKPRGLSTRKSTRPAISSKNLYCRLKQFRTIATRYEQNRPQFARRNPPRRRNRLAPT